MTTAAQNTPDTLGALLAAGRAQLQNCSESSQLDAELLLTLATGADRATLYANPDRIVSATDARCYLQFITARANGQPIAYLTGEREFWSLALEIDQHTLIPRPETELLVERSLTRIPVEGICEVLELGTGSGAIATAIAAERTACAITATDNCSDSLDVAQRNFARHCPDRIHVLHGDWFAALSDDKVRFDVIVSNPPYIGLSEKALTDRELAFEPETALYSGSDGLDAIRQIIAQAPDYLKSQGWLILEHGLNQAEQIANLLNARGFANVCDYADLNGLPRVTEGRLS